MRAGVHGGQSGIEGEDRNRNHDGMDGKGNIKEKRFDSVENKGQGRQMKGTGGIAQHSMA